MDVDEEVGSERGDAVGVEGRVAAGAGEDVGETGGAEEFVVEGAFAGGKGGGVAAGSVGDDNQNPFGSPGGPCGPGCPGADQFFHGHTPRGTGCGKAVGTVGEEAAEGVGEGEDVGGGFSAAFDDFAAEGAQEGSLRGVGAAQHGVGGAEGREGGFVGGEEVAHDGQGRGFGRVVAEAGAADDAGAEAEGVESLGRAGEEGDDAHGGIRGVVWRGRGATWREEEEGEQNT